MSRVNRRAKPPRHRPAEALRLHPAAIESAGLPVPGGIAAPHRPLLRYFGGKWSLAEWIVSQFPPHELYVEPYGGAASVLLRKPRSKVEVLNDIDVDLSNLYRVVLDRQSLGLLSMLLLCTPYSADQLALAHEPADDDVERARRIIVRHALGHAPGRQTAASTGFRRYTGARRSAAAHDWARYVDGLGAINARLRGVVLENRDAVDVMRYHDRKDALHYVDPPYTTDERLTPDVGYAHELDRSGQERLLACLLRLKGHVVLSGYRNALYDEALHGWGRVTKAATDNGRNRRQECLWLSPSAVAASSQLSLF